MLRRAVSRHRQRREVASRMDVSRRISSLFSFRRVRKTLFEIRSSNEILAKREIVAAFPTASVFSLFTRVSNVLPKLARAN